MMPGNKYQLMSLSLMEFVIVATFIMYMAPTSYIRDFLKQFKRAMFHSVIEQVNEFVE